MLDALPTSKFSLYGMVLGSHVPSSSNIIVISSMQHVLEVPPVFLHRKASRCALAGREFRLIVTYLPVPAGCKPSVPL